MTGLDEGGDEDPDGIVREERGGDGADGEPGGSAAHSAHQNFTELRMNETMSLFILVIQSSYKA